MSDEIRSHLANIVESAEEALEALNATSTKPVLLKALKDQDRFKLSSVWIKLANGEYQHLQSGRITTAERLAGFTRVIDRG